VGTISIDVSEENLHTNSKKEKVDHEVLNAKHHEREAEIIANAGQYGKVTIATNMAGRGTDIKLSAESKEAGGLHILGNLPATNQDESTISCVAVQGVRVIPDPPVSFSLWKTICFVFSGQAEYPELWIN